MTLEHTRSYIMEQLIHQENVSDDMTERWKTTQNSSTNLSLSSRDLLFTNVASGLTAGMVAAFLTTPVDTIYVNKISVTFNKFNIPFFYFKYKIIPIRNKFFNRFFNSRIIL